MTNNDPTIRISNLSFTYPGALRPSLNNISLEIERGDFLAVIGGNGCGKSTFCKALNGLIPHFFSGEFDGSVELDGLDTLSHGVGELAKKIGYVYQDFENQILRPTVLDDASFACLNYAMKDYLAQGREALRQIGLADKEEDYVWQLSGGQKHLLALAGAAALKPDILVLDEPVAQLDPQHAFCIYDLLRELNEKYGKTILVIEHHTEFIARYCKHVMLMRDGGMLWKLPANEALNRVDELLENDIHPPQITLAAHRFVHTGAVSADTQLPTTQEEGKAFFEGFTPTGHAVARQKAAKPQANAAIQFRDVCVKYRAVKGKDPVILEHFSLDVHRGEKIALIGCNGAGKTTILKLMTGLLKPKGGVVTVCGASTSGRSPEDISRDISLVYQNPEEMFIRDCIRDDIEYAMRVRGMKDYERRAQELMAMFNLQGLAERDGRLLSGGQMRRASLAVGIALNPAILLLDEPTANLDISTRKEIAKTLEALNDVVETTIIATHDMQLVAEWAERIIVLYRGAIIADGTREKVFGDSRAVELAGIRPPDIYLMGKALHDGAQCFTVDEFIGHFKPAVEEGIAYVKAR